MVQVARSLALFAVMAMALPALAPNGSAGLIPDCFANFPPCPPGIPQAPGLPGLPQAPPAPALPDPSTPMPPPDVSPLEGFVGSFADQMTDAAGPIAAAALPGDGSSLLLLGGGTVHLRRAGLDYTCGGEPRMLLEASQKAFGFEPTATMVFGGGQGEGGFALPCSMGEARQPTQYDITGSFAGAWHARKDFPQYWWTLDVSAPGSEDSRTVVFHYQALNGDVDDFVGTLAAYR